MRAWRALALLPILAALAALPALAAYYRPIQVTFSSNATAGQVLVVSVPRLLVDGFQGLYVASDPSCLNALPTWHSVLGDYVVVMFKLPQSYQANTSATFYLCYGDVYYQPQQLLEEKYTGSVTATAKSSEEVVSGRPATYLYVPAGSSTDYTVDLGQLSHVDQANFTYELFTSGTVTAEILDDQGNVIASLSGSGWYTWYTITGEDFDTRTVTIRFTAQGANAWVYLDSYTILYRPYVYNESSVSYNTSNVLLIYLDGDTGYVKFNATPPGMLVYVDGSLNGTQLGEPVVLLVSPDGYGFYGSASEGDYEATKIETKAFNLTIAAYAYGYDASSTIFYDVFEGSAPPSYSYVIGGASQVSIPGGGGGGTTTAPGNVSYQVQVNIESRDWQAIAVWAGGVTLVAALALAAYAFHRPGWVWYLPAVAAAFTSAYLYNYAGDYRMGMLALATGLITAVILYLLETLRVSLRAR